MAAVVAVLVAAVVLDVAGRRLLDVRGFGPAVIACLFVFNWFAMGVIEGSPLPLSVLWMAAIVATLSGPWPLSPRRVALVGLFMAMLVLTRLDNVFVLVFVPLALLAVRVLRPRQLLAYAVGLLAGLSPWILYSLVRFRSPFVTPYAGSGLSAKLTTPVDYFVQRPPSVFEQPGDFANRMTSGWSKMLGAIDVSVRDAVVMRPAVLLTVVVLLAAVVGPAAVAVRRGVGLRPALQTASDDLRRRLGACRGVRLLVPLALAMVLASVASQLLGSAFDARYWSLPFLSVYLACGAVVLAAAGPRRAMAVLLPVLLFVGLIPYLGQTHHVHLQNDLLLQAGWVDPEPVSDRILSCLGPNDRAMYLGGTADAYIMGAMTTRVGVAQPLNWGRISVADRRRFLEDYAVTSVVVDPATGAAQRDFALKALQRDLGGVPLRPTCGGFVYAIGG